MILVIGIGNPLRRDDGAGPLLAEALAALLQALLGGAAHTLLVQQLAPEHALEVADPAVTAVLFCDAALPQSDAPPLHAKRLALLTDEGARLTHDLTPAALMAYASLLLASGGTLPPAWVVTVAAHNLEHGEGLSAPTEAAMAGAAWLATQLAGEIAAARPDSA